MTLTDILWRRVRGNLRPGFPRLYAAAQDLHTLKRSWCSIVIIIINVNLCPMPLQLLAVALSVDKILASLAQQKKRRTQFSPSSLPPLPRHLCRDVQIPTHTTRHPSFHKRRPGLCCRVMGARQRHVQQKQRRRPSPPSPQTHGHATHVASRRSAIRSRDARLQTHTRRPLSPFSPPLCWVCSGGVVVYWVRQANSYVIVLACVGNVVLM